jgi:hypothetical protein
VAISGHQKTGKLGNSVLANRRLQPLGHLSIADNQRLTTIGQIFVELRVDYCKHILMYRPATKLAQTWLATKIPNQIMLHESGIYYLRVKPKQSRQIRADASAYPFAVAGEYNKS